MSTSTRQSMAVALALGIALAAAGWARAQEMRGPADPPRDALEQGGPEAGDDWGPGAGGPGSRGHLMGMRGDRAAMLRELELTPEQRDKVAELRDREERAAIRTRADLETARLDLRRLMRAERPDRAAINRQLDRITQLGGELRKSRLNTMLDIRGLLTPEQQQKLRERRGA